MKTRLLRVAVALAISLAASLTWAADDELRALVEESRRVSNQLLGQIKGELVKELERTGPIRAIAVCKYSVPEITSNISRQTGMRVTRVALKPRNRALAEPDVWEQKVLLDFEKRLANGERAETLEFFEKVDEPAGRAFRYMKAITMAQPCLACHGPVKNLSEGIRAQLAAEYPNDKAVEYEIGQLRGGVSVKKGL